MAAAATLAAAPLAAEEPIVLNNDDVARLHAKEVKTSPAAPAPARSSDDALAADSTDPAPDPAETARRDAELQRRLDQISRRSMSAVSRTLDARLSDAAAGALPSIPDPPPVGAAPSMPAAPAPASLDTDDEPTVSLFPETRPEPEPACIYGPRGHLLHAPPGLQCAKVRHGQAARTIQGVGAQAKPTSTRSSGEEAVGCVYGSRGQLLYASPGKTCAKDD